MRIQTLLCYLIGSRKAILEIASNAWAAPLGLIFVLSAGLAREYDGADLLHEPWHALLPIPASLAASFLLFCLAYIIPVLRTASGTISLPRPRFWTGYRMFLGLFWLTAPLAWFYAIPYERFMGPGAATRANLWTLGLVALWRVLLMCRVLNVLIGYAAWEAAALVFVLGDAEVLLAVRSPVPIIEVMGGIRYTESQLIIRQAVKGILVLGVCSFPFWFILAWVAAVKARPAWQVWRIAQPETRGRSKGVAILACLSVLVWVLVLPFTQPEQILRRRVEKMLEAGQIEDALDEMSAHEASAFPPHWDPPPWTVSLNGDAPSQLLDVVEMIVERPAAPWVRELYVAKFRRFIYDPSMSKEVATRAARLLEILPEGPAIKQEFRREPEWPYLPVGYLMKKEEKEK